MSTVMILVMVGLGVFLVVTASSAVRLPMSRPVHPTDKSDPRPAVDHAQEELRLRYARGEIGREEFLQRRIDLE